MSRILLLIATLTSIVACSGPGPTEDVSPSAIQARQTKTEQAAQAMGAKSWDGAKGGK